MANVGWICIEEVVLVHNSHHVHTQSCLRGDLRLIRQKNEDNVLVGCLYILYYKLLLNTRVRYTDKFVHIRNNIRIMICKQHNTWYRPMNVMKDKMRHQQSLLMDFQKFSRPEITFMALQALNQISDDKTKKNCPVVRVITRTSYQFVFSLFTPWQFQSSAICLVRKHFLK